MMKEKITLTNFKPNEWIIILQSMKIGTHEKKAIQSNTDWPCLELTLCPFIEYNKQIRWTVVPRPATNLTLK